MLASLPLLHLLKYIRMLKNQEVNIVSVEETNGTVEVKWDSIKEIELSESEEHYPMNIKYLNSSGEVT